MNETSKKLRELLNSLNDGGLIDPTSDSFETAKYLGAIGVDNGLTREGKRILESFNEAHLRESFAPGSKWFCESEEKYIIILGQAPVPSGVITDAISQMESDFPDFSLNVRVVFTDTEKNVLYITSGYVDDINESYKSTTDLLDDIQRNWS